MAVLASIGISGEKTGPAEAGSDAAAYCGKGLGTISGVVRCSHRVGGIIKARAKLL